MGVQIPLWEGAILNQKGRPIVKYRDTLSCAVQNQLKQLKCRWVEVSGGSKEPCIRWRWTLAPPDEYHWTIHMRWRCGLLLNYFDQLLLLLLISPLCSAFALFMHTNNKLAGLLVFMGLVCTDHSCTTFWKSFLCVIRYWTCHENRLQFFCVHVCSLGSNPSHQSQL